MRRKLLWIDGFAALTAGLTVLLLSGWLSNLYGVPQNLLIFTGAVNLAYSCYSLSLAMRKERPLKLIVFLVCANLSWAPVCFFLAFSYSSTATIFGLGHLIGEGLFVGSLGCLEWRWREFLKKRYDDEN